MAEREKRERWTIPEADRQKAERSYGLDDVVRRAEEIEQEMERPLRECQERADSLERVLRVIEAASGPHSVAATPHQALYAIHQEARAALGAEHV